MKKLIAILSLLAAGSLPAQVEMTIAEMQEPGAFGPDSSGHCGELVTVEGVGLSSSEHFYAGSHSTFYMIDPEGGDYTGLLVYSPESDAFEIAVGDLVQVTGIVKEYFTESEGHESIMTELVPQNPDVDVEVIDYDQDLPDPVLVDMWYLDPIRHDEHVAEIYEGMLVEIHDAVVVDNTAPDSWRQFTVADPEGNETVIRTAAYELDDYGRPPLGASFEMIRGVIYQVYGNYNVMPRGLDDLILAVGPPIISGTDIGPCGATPADFVEVSTNISDDTAVDEAFVFYRANGGGWLQYDLERDPDSVVRFFVDLPAQPEGSLVEIYIEAVDDEGETSWDPPEGPDAEGFPALYVTGIEPVTCYEIQSSHYADGGSWYQCHNATLTGIITMGYTDFGFTEEDTYRTYFFEDAGGAWNGLYIYNTQSHDVWLDQLERGDMVTLTGEITEYNSLTEMSYIADFELHSSGNDLTPTDIDLAVDFEGAEESWESVLVTLSYVTVLEDAGYGEWLVQDQSGAQIILDNLGVWDLEIGVGANADAITGPITYNYGAWKIAPRDNGDFVNFSAVDELRKVPGFSLRGNYPNPFNPVTTLVFELDRPAELRAEVFNLLGERVALLSEGSMSAGEHRLSWDAAGLASGVYVARLSLSGGEGLQQKMLLLK